jgi:hypothetical protein
LIQTRSRFDRYRCNGRPLSHLHRLGPREPEAYDVAKFSLERRASVPVAVTPIDGAVQTVYPRKNWSSLMLFNCDHPSVRALTSEVVNRAHLVLVPRSPGQSVVSERARAAARSEADLAGIDSRGCRGSSGFLG